MGAPVQVPADRDDGPLWAVEADVADETARPVTLARLSLCRFVYHAPALRHISRRLLRSLACRVSVDRDRLGQVRGRPRRAVRQARRRRVHARRTALRGSGLVLRHHFRIVL